ncbi:GTP-binding protein [uncultured Thomasclavelia sp.]|uniref:GTP-binding protein n=1 Tax=uncultured Thomasclavelia sp. TaxID=3025759 RepID=UPI00280BD64B|nr:GTP-binding protein [uncultured Thomasclavelia sp.]
MIKIDLITGFLGAGKTTFMINYAKYLVKQNLKVGIIENDFGAVNVDMMLLQENVGDCCDLEMISGGSDLQTYRRRFKTKLIAMKMVGYDRVLIEPSGIFDVDDFFDLLYEDPLQNWYEIGNVIAIVDASLEENLSKESNFLLASQVANAGKIIFSRVQDTSKIAINNTVNHINDALKAVSCKRIIDDVIICKNWNDFSDEDFRVIVDSGYVVTSYQKLHFNQNQTYSSLYFMNVKINIDILKQQVNKIISDPKCGHVFRVKGFIQDQNNNWYQLNATKNEINIQPINQGQEIIIVIGESLDQEVIEQYLNNPQ